ncbi:MAG: helix-turn-helix transcriptional regulator [Sphaerospermopsis sp. SIO1G1]|nr:helix-turn-helix transcriptional regulator [Sphaerospermopsis sp. SIO1G1]
MKVVTVKNHPFPRILYCEYILLALLMILINCPILPSWLFFQNSSLPITLILNLLVVVFWGIGLLLPWNKDLKPKILFTCFELFLIIFISYLGHGKGLIIPYIVVILRNVFLFNELRKSIIILWIAILGLIFNLMYLLKDIESVIPLQNTFDFQAILSLTILFGLVFTLILVFLTFFLNFIVIEKKTVVKIDVDKIHQLQNLTKKQKEVLKYFLTENCPTNKEMAEGLYLSYGTVRNHMSNIMQKLDIKNRTQLALLKEIMLPDLQ